MKKLDGNGGVLRKVNDALAGLASGAIDTDEYIDLLSAALTKLGAFANQLEGKAQNGQIEDPELSSLRGFVDDAAALIDELIASA